AAMARMNATSRSVTVPAPISVRIAESLRPWPRITGDGPAYVDVMSWIGFAGLAASGVAASGVAASGLALRLTARAADLAREGLLALGICFAPVGFGLSRHDCRNTN